jgi:hypothetical protein
MIAISIEKGRRYQRQELLNLGFTESKIQSPNYVVFRKSDKYYLFIETFNDRLILDYVGY